MRRVTPYARRLLRALLRGLVLPVIDRLILWSFGWRRVWLEGYSCGPHYIDPANPDCYLLLDQAVRVASDRARTPRH